MAEIHFRRDTAFRKQVFVPDSFAHPAKMDSQLLMWLVSKYTEPNETILDPMAGSGTTMLACMFGRNVVLVELEEKFCRMMRDNWELVRMKPQLGCQMGTCQIIQGDARNLEGLLADKIITSPPYTDNPTGGGLNTKPPRKGHNDQTGRSPASPSQKAYADKIITSPPFQEPDVRRKGMGKSREGYDYGSKLKMSSEHPDNISRLAETNYGDIDKIITSPPYAEQKTGGEQGAGKYTGTDLSQGLKRVKDDYAETDSPQNIGNKPYGDIDKIITSPPYEEAMGKKHHSPRADKLAQEKSNPVTYTDRIDSIITSPPYEGSISGEEKDKSEKLIERQSGREKWGKHLRLGESTLHTYSNNGDNIGNLKSDTYLKAMLQVYQQCFKVLKDGGLMILVTKNFIRNRQVVRLDTDTIKLCEQAGFSYVERHWRKLPAQSFWRVIYYKKHPEVERINYEDVLIFRK